MESGLSHEFLDFIQGLNDEGIRILNSSQSEDLSSLASMAIQEDIDIIYQYKSDKLRFFGISEGTYLEIKLLNMQYSDIKSVSNALKMIPDIRIYELITRKYHFTLVQETWMLASCVEFNNKIPLTLILKGLKKFSPGAKLPIESILILIVKATELASEIFSKMKVVGPFYPDNIYFLKKSPGIEVFFEVFTIEFLQKRARFSNLYQEKYGFSLKAFFWSLGVITYSCLSGLDLNELPSFALLSNYDIETLIDKLEFIPGLTPMLKSFFDGSINDFDTIIKSNIFQTWSFILSCSTKQPEILCPHGFYTAFYFTCKPLIYQNMPFLCTSECFVKEISSELYIKQLIYTKLIEHLTFFPELNEGMLEFSLQFLIKLKEISPVSIRKLCLQLIFRLIKLKINLDDTTIRKLLIKTLKTLLNDSTLTVQMIFQNAGIIYYLYDNFSADSKDLFSFISSLGAKSIEYIKFFRSSNKYSEPNQSILYMQLIPIHFKLQMTYHILQEMDDLMKTWAPALIFDNKKIHSMYLAVTILYELLQAGKEAKTCNQLGTCYKNLLSYKVSPVMVNCASCNKQLCLSCAQHHIELTHKINFLTHYRIGNFICQEESPTLYSIHASRNTLPPCEEICLEHCSVENSVYTWNFKTLVIPAEVNSNVLFYGEIFFAKCESENIILSIQGAKIDYDNNIPAIVKNHAFYCNMPRIGATDTLGVGITGDSKVFFTYNGFNLGRYVEFSSKEIRIDIKIDSFTEPILNGNSPCLYNMQAYNFLDKERLNDYKCISNIFVVLVLLKKKIMKKCISWSINLYSVVDNLKSILDFNSLKQKLKKDSSPQTPGQGCKPF